MGIGELNGGLGLVSESTAVKLTSEGEGIWLEATAEFSDSEPVPVWPSGD